MLRPDPVPPIGPLKIRFIRIMRWAALFSVAVGAVAVVLVARGDSELHIHMLIATALGVGVSVLLGAALMALILLSNSTGFDADAADHKDKNPQ
jgi:hypothetical protein